MYNTLVEQYHAASILSTNNIVYQIVGKEAGSLNHRGHAGIDRETEDQARLPLAIQAQRRPISRRIGTDAARLTNGPAADVAALQATRLPPAVAHGAQRGVSTCLWGVESLAPRRSVSRSVLRLILLGFAAGSLGRLRRARRCRKCDVDRQDRKRRACSSAVDRGRIERQGAIDRSDELFLRQGLICGHRAGRRHGDHQRHRAGRRRGSSLRQPGPDGLCLLDRPPRQGLFRKPDRWRARCRERPLGAARHGVRRSYRGGQLRPVRPARRAGEMAA
jgi:hypothetical protein